MATKKTTTTKKTTSRKAAPRKAPVTKKKISRKKPAQMKTFKLASEQQKFLSFNPTIQTFYWVVLGVIVIMFTAWIMKLQSDVNLIYDQIDANDSTIIEEPLLQKNKSEE